MKTSAKTAKAPVKTSAKAPAKTPAKARASVPAPAATPKPQPPVLVYSKPTRCVKCSIVNEMTHPLGSDPKTGAWTCARCGHQYLFAHWKIHKAGRAKE